MTSEARQGPKRRGLSARQRHILGWLLFREREITRRGSTSERLDLVAFGVRWCPGLEARREGAPWSASDRATFSRAVARLEQRGLVGRRTRTGGRYAYADGWRTSHLRLTETGRAEAERITAAERDRRRRETANND